MLRTIVNIAMRHLLGRPRQTLTTLAGVAVSTMVLITTISLTRGLLDSFVETIVDAAPHITLKGEELEPLPVDLISDAARGVGHSWWRISRRRSGRRSVTTVVCLICSIAGSLVAMLWQRHRM